MSEKPFNLPNPVSLSKAFHPCPPYVTEHLHDISTVHDTLAESTILDSLSHTTRETVYELEPVIRGLGKSFSASLAQNPLNVSDLRNARKAAIEKEATRFSDVQTQLREEALKWKEKRKALDEEVKAEEARIEEDFKRGLRDAARLGLSV